MIAPSRALTDGDVEGGAEHVTLYEILARSSTAEMCEWREDRDSHAYGTSSVHVGSGRVYAPNGPDPDLAQLCGAMAKAAIS